MKLVIPKGATSRIITVFIQNNSVTTGAGLGALTNASGIVGGFVREGSTGVALAVDEDVTTEGTYQAPSAQGKVRIGTPANMRTGTYELHFHNNLWATGAETVTITLGGAANMADLPIEVQLSDPVSGLGAPSAITAIKTKTDELTFTGAGVVDANMIAVNNNSTAALMMALVYSGIVTPFAVDLVNNDGDFTIEDNGGSLNSADDVYNDQFLVFTNGLNAGIPRAISDYTGATKRVQFLGSAGAKNAPFPAQVQAADVGFIVGLAR